MERLKKMELRFLINVLFLILMPIKNVIKSVRIVFLKTFVHIIAIHFFFFFFCKICALFLQLSIYKITRIFPDNIRSIVISCNIEQFVINCTSIEYLNMYSFFTIENTMLYTQKYFLLQILDFLLFIFFISNVAHKCEYSHNLHVFLNQHVF